MAQIRLTQQEAMSNLPMVCAVSGRPANRHLHHTFRWSPVPMMGHQVMVLISYLTSRTMSVRLPVSAEYESIFWRPTMFVGGAFAAMFLAFGLGIAAAAGGILPMPMGAIAIFGIFVVGIIGVIATSIWASTTIPQPVEISDDSITLTNVSHQFVQAVERQRREAYEAYYGIQPGQPQPGYGPQSGDGFLPPNFGPQPGDPLPVGALASTGAPVANEPGSSRKPPAKGAGKAPPIKKSAPPPPSAPAPQVGPVGASPGGFSPGAPYMPPPRSGFPLWIFGIVAAVVLIPVLGSFVIFAIVGATAVDVASKAKDAHQAATRPRPRPGRVAAKDRAAPRIDSVPAALRGLRSSNADQRMAALEYLGRANADVKYREAVITAVGKLAKSRDGREKALASLVVSRYVAADAVAGGQVPPIPALPDVPGVPSDVEAGGAPVESEPVDPFEKQLANLRGGDHFRAKSAAKWFAEQEVDPERQQDVVDAMNAAMGHGDGFVNGEVLGALKVWGTKDNVPAILDILQNDAFKNEVCLSLLADLHDPRALPVAVEMLNNPFGDGEAAARMIAAFPEAEQTMLALLHDPRGRARGRARQVLEELGTSDERLLGQTLTDLKSVESERTKSALDWLASREPIDAERDSVCAAVAETLPTHAAAAAKTLATWAGPEQADLFKPLLTHGDRNVKSTALRKLVELDAPGLAAALLPEMQEEQAMFIVLNDLQRIGPPAEDVAIEFLRQDNPKIVTHTCYLLGRIGSKKSLQPLTVVGKQAQRLKAREVFTAANHAFQQVSKRVQNNDA